MYCALSEPDFVPLLVVTKGEKDMEIQSSMYASAVQQAVYSSNDRVVASQQSENESVSTRPVERVTPAEAGEAPTVGARLDVFA
jgi:hypothetical protein